MVNSFNCRFAALDGIIAPITEGPNSVGALECRLSRTTIEREFLRKQQEQANPITNFAKWVEENISLDRMILKWSGNCETCPVQTLDEFCKSYKSNDDCGAKLRRWAETNQ